MWAFECMRADQCLNSHWRWALHVDNFPVYSKLAIPAFRLEVTWHTSALVVRVRRGHALGQRLRVCSLTLQCFRHVLAGLFRCQSVQPG